MHAEKHLYGSSKSYKSVQRHRKGVIHLCGTKLMGLHLSNKVIGSHKVLPLLKGCTRLSH